MSRKLRDHFPALAGIRLLPLLAAIACVLAMGGCSRKPAEDENLPPKPDTGGRMPMVNQGQAGGGSGQVAQPQTD